MAAFLVKIHAIRRHLVRFKVSIIHDAAAMKRLRVFDRFFRFLALRGVADGAAKFAVIVLIILGSLLGFTQLYLGRLPEGYDYYALASLSVGGPWVVLFYGVNTYQVGLQKRLSRLSRKDGLTGLNNRRTFFDLTQRSEIRSAGGVVLMMDADNFKSINDTHGHAAGDECLKAIAYRISRNLRETDVGGRLGGEEFAVFLGGANLAQARIIAERLLQPIPYSRPDYEDNFTVTLSIGGVSATNQETIDTLLNRADDALYQAKQNGKSQLVMWAPDQTASDPAAA